MNTTDSTTAHTVTHVGLLKFAHAALKRYLAIEPATTIKARQIAGAEFQGMCVAADRLGLTNTPDHMHMIVMDSVREAEPRPAYRAMGNDAQKAWDDSVSGRIAARILSGDIG